VDFPRIHQIQALLEYLPSNIVVPPSVYDAADLSDYAIEGRYPQSFEDVTQEEYFTALDKSRVVVTWAEKTISRKNTHEIHEPQVVYRVPKPRKKPTKTKKPRRKV
jgi:hypothetical protein